ncbi:MULTISPECIES: deoxynucleoside kinase [Paraclostridium]|uniref:Deoxynucleoside kinase n=1 Tax=Paraclostridium bifermentans TaxID=1490 RepID=A0AA44II74_PARBF|nr:MULTISPECIES: deoxynucleoside kinase [Paraclostridium]KGJ48780.1 deoxyguanosine kinase [Clostridium sp. NCR]MDV8113630.1 deoxynucleoside kinase [Bacillus sp. BAU-SS-2023]EQK48723.1 deoxyguanosine kinase [[Clostridium] bifermentans ATCC 19299] [Paraclostridium bifermentans ATCC 19299]MBN8049065.1 deoxynucleoside kinase [Paraclostridium bifermentans]MBZ6006427.1 deoxynucleoside kinase [Paraclostridium bifermentans]
MNSRGIFIAIEGPIGVGKTTLANILNNHFNCTLLREIVEENPFLSKFYTDIKEYALQTESFFLFNRIKQLEDTEKNLLSQGTSVVSDYHIIKNLIFAGITLDNMQFYKYKQMYNIFINDLPQPDIIIYLNSNTDVLMNRIAMRDRSFERQMDRNYIQELSTEYKYYFNPLSIKHNFVGKEPLILEIDNSNLDFLNNDNDRKFIIKKVEDAINSLGGHENV